MTDTFTPNLRLRKASFNTRIWQDKVNDNFAILDAAFGNIFSISGMRGVWDNATAYIVNDAVVDPDLGTIWKCLVSHTSAATGTFLEDRIAHPSNWTAFYQAAGNRGEWASGVAYNYNDFVVRTVLGVGRWCICLSSHTSGASFDTDLAAGKWAVLIDGNLYILPSLAGAGDGDMAVLSDPTGTSYQLTSMSALAAKLNLTAVLGAPWLRSLPTLSSLDVTDSVAVGDAVATGKATITQVLQVPWVNSLTAAGGGLDVTDSLPIGDTVDVRKATITEVMVLPWVTSLTADTPVVTDILPFGDLSGADTNKATITQVMQTPWVNSLTSDTPVATDLLPYGDLSSVDTRQATLQAVFDLLVTNKFIAWTQTTPVPTPFSGTFTTVSSVLRKLILGKLVIFSLVITITTNGTAAGFINIVFGGSNLASSFGGGGRRADNGMALSTQIGVGGTTMVIHRYDATYPGADGAILCVNGVYETV